MLTIAVTAVVLATGCARPLPRHPQAVPTQAETIPASQSATEIRDAEVYEQILRRYLNTPADNSFPANTFKTVYILDHVRSDAGNPIGDTHAGQRAGHQRRLHHGTRRGNPDHPRHHRRR
jgi:hypothetical protein